MFCFDLHKEGLGGDGPEDKLVMVSNRLSVLETQMEAVLRNKGMVVAFRQSVV